MEKLEPIKSRLRSAKNYINEKNLLSKKNISYAAIILLVLLAAFLPVIIEKAQQKETIDASVLETEAVLASISRTISGTGTLTAEESYNIDIPEGVDITKYLVSEGQIVSKGDALAAVDRTSVLKAIGDVSEKMKEVEQDMSSAEDGQEDPAVKAKLPGTVKTVYAQKGDKVRDVMKEHGCLAVIEVKGTGDELYVSAVTGTVKTVYYKEGQEVYAGARLFDLTDVDFAAEYEILAQQHRQYEDITERLFQMYENGCLTAPCDGFVSNIEKSLEVKTVRAQGIAYTTERTFSTTAESDCAAGNDMLRFKDETEPAPVDHQIVPYGEDIAKGDILFVRYTEIYSGDSSEEPGEVTDACYEILSTYRSPGKENPKGGGFSGGGMSMGGGGFSAEEEEVSSEIVETTAMNVTPMTEMTITITLDELDVLNASVGQKAQVTIDALPGRAYEGTVTSIETTGSNSGGNSKYTAEVLVDYDENMLPGMNASILINVSTKDNIVSVPVAALSEEDGKTVIYTAYDRKRDSLKDPVEVQTGISDGINVEIIEGIVEGQTLYYMYYDQVKIQGMPGSRR